MSLQDPLLEFPLETTSAPLGNVSSPLLWEAPASPTWPLPHAQPLVIGSTSRVVSFVMGFALASVIYWIGSIPADEVVTTAESQVSAEPVVSTATVNTPPTQSTATAATLSAATPVPATPRAATPATTATVRSTRPSTSAVTPRERRPVASGYRGALVLSSNPEGAQVVLNGKVVGQTPIVLEDLPAGSRAVIVRRDGYSPWSASVRVVANQRTPVRATLLPLNQRTGG